MVLLVRLRIRGNRALRNSATLGTRPRNKEGITPSRKRPCLSSPPCQHWRAMSGRARRSLFIACLLLLSVLLLLLLGVLIAGTLRPPETGLRLTLLRSYTNDPGYVLTRVWLSNPCPYKCYFDAGKRTGHSIQVEKEGILPSHTGSNFLLHATPPEIAVAGGRYYSSNLIDRALRKIDRRSKWTIYTLEIPE